MLSWNISSPLYLQCYKKWLIKSIKEKNSLDIERILNANKVQHLNFFNDNELLNILDEKKQTILKSSISSINRSNITAHDISNLVRILIT